LRLCLEDRLHLGKTQIYLVFRSICTIFATVKRKNDRIMEARTTMYPQEGQLLVSISDMSMMKDIKKAIGMLKGVSNVTVPRRKRISAYERSLQELEEGRVYEAKDVDDLFKQCLG
jgi:hypothetical protein